MFDVLASILAFFYDHAGHNIGVAIILFTVAIMVALFPFTAKSTRSMAAMQRLQPDIKRLQQQYKNDRQTLNEEMMALYKEHGVNPLGGCLPMLLQFPVFFVLYRVLYGLTRVHKGTEGFDPKYLSHSSALYKDLVGKTELVWHPFGFDLAKSANQALKIGFTASLPFVVLVGLSIATGVYQQRQITKRQPQQNLDDNPQAAAMQKMGKFFPLMFGVISWGFPAGLVLYFVTSNLFRIGQQFVIYRLDPSLAHASSTTVVDARSSEKRPAKGNGRATGTTLPSGSTKAGAGKGNGSKGNGSKGNGSKGNGLAKGNGATKGIPAGQGNGSGTAGTGPAKGGGPVNGGNGPRPAVAGAALGGDRSPAEPAPRPPATDGQGKTVLVGRRQPKKSRKGR